MINKKIKLLIYISFLFVICLICNNNRKPEIRVGIIDSMIDNYSIESNVNVKKFCNEDYVEAVNHGNIVLSLINSNSNYNIYYAEVLNNRLEADIDDIVNAIEWCISNDVHIINMSFSTLIDNYKLQRVIQKASDNGIIIVSSNFNNTTQFSYPASYENVISVSVDYNSTADIVLNESYFYNDIEVCNSYACAMVTKQICESLYNS